MPEDKNEGRSRRLFLLYKRRSRAHAFIRNQQDDTLDQQTTALSTSNTSTKATSPLSHIHHEDHDLRSPLKIIHH
jgi:hypothetical protein